MKRKLSILVLLFPVLLLLGAKGCEAGVKAGTKTPAVHEINTKEDIIEMLPELNKYAGKFDIKRYDDFIKLITNNDLSFREAVHKLKTETSMNIPAYIILYSDKKEFLDKGELKLELNAGKVVSYTGGELAPYLGVIFIFDGFWTAVEFNAIALFTGTINNDDGKVLVTEYAYVNETVFRNNSFSSERAFLSRFNEDIEGERVKGDGSIPKEIVTEFDK
jgi:hypothetical protein